MASHGQGVQQDSKSDVVANMSDKGREDDTQIREEQKAEFNRIDAELVEKQLESIKKEVEEDCPLISSIEAITLLEKEFANNIPFLEKIQFLKQKFTRYRRVRRDGSCFYRAFLFRVMEYIILSNDKELLQNLINTIKGSKEYLKNVGFEEFVLDEFQDILLEKLEIIGKPESTTEELMSIFCDKMTSDCLVMQMRFLTSGYLKKNEAVQENYIEGFFTIDHFCQTEVEPIDKEADQIQIIALINYINIPIRILQLDANLQVKEPTVFLVPEGTDPYKVYVNLLYRPGHYDILYQ